MSKPTVLIIEDEPELANLYSIWLEEDYTVRTAHDGEEGLSKLDSTVDIVLLDRRMPGQSGDEVLEQIKEHSTECRVAMVTAVEPDFDIIEMDIDDYLLKPVTAENLTSTIDGLTTRNEYDERLDEYLSLLEKKSTLETEKSQPALEDSPAFQQLEQRIDELEDQVDSLVERFDDVDATAMFRDL